VLRDITTKKGSDGNAAQKQAPRSTPESDKPTAHDAASAPVNSGATAASTQKASKPTDAAPSTTNSSKFDSTADTTTPAPVPAPAPEPLVLQVRDFVGANMNANADAQTTEASTNDSAAQNADAAGSNDAAGGQTSAAGATNGSPAFLSLGSRFIAARFPSAQNAPKGATAAKSATAAANGKASTSGTSTQAPSATTSSSSSSQDVAPTSAATPDSSANQSAGQADANAAAMAAAMLGITNPATPAPAAAATATSNSRNSSLTGGTDSQIAAAGAGATDNDTAATVRNRTAATFAVNAGTPQIADAADTNDQIEDTASDDGASVRGLAGANAFSGSTESLIGASLRTSAGLRQAGGVTKTGANSTNATASLFGGNSAGKSQAPSASSLPTKVGTPAAASDIVRSAAAPSAASTARPTLTISMPDLVSFNTNRSAAGALDAPALLASDTDAPAVVSQIVQAMRVQALQGGGTAEVTLQPGYLGGVSLSVKVNQDGVSASVVADTPAVREALRTQEPALRQALADQGLKLEHFDVSEPAETPRKQSGGGQQAPQDQPRQSRQKRRDPSEPAFEFVA
jgi:flagellar hook-length control protein FliK